MHITCSICSDLITGSDDTFTTKCGHLFQYNCISQWLETSKTCPQCRSKVYEKDIHRVYFNVENIDGSDDPSSLQNKIDSLKFKLKMKDVEIKTAKEGKVAAEAINKALRNEVKNGEEKAAALNGAVLSLKERLNHFKNENKKMNKLQEENKTLQSQIETLHGLETIRVGSAAEVDELLNSLAGSSTESRSLATYCSALKRELQEMGNKRKVLQAKTKEYSQNLSLAYAERDSLKDALLISDRAQADLIEELFNVKDELSEAEKKLKEQRGIINNPQNSDTANSAQNILVKLIGCSPSKESTATEMLRLLSESPAPEELLVKLKNVAKSPRLLYPATENEANKRRRLEEARCLSPRLPPTKTNIHPGKFPKLSDPTLEDEGFIVKPSSSGCQLKSECKNNASHVKQSFSIFQKQRLYSTREESVQKNLREEIYYDGMGGHQKCDIFPNPRRNTVAVGARPKVKKLVAINSKPAGPPLENFLTKPSQ